MRFTIASVNKEDPVQSIKVDMEDPQDKAKAIAFTYIKKRLEKTDTHVTFALDEVYVVWFSYVLGNWKALISTTLPDGMYYEITYNKQAKVTYVDAYKKFDNEAVPDAEL